MFAHVAERADALVAVLVFVIDARRAERRHGRQALSSTSRQLLPYFV